MSSEDKNRDEEKAEVRNLIEWIGEQQMLIAQAFDISSKLIASASEGQPEIRLMHNAIFAGHLRRMVEYLQATYDVASDDTKERLKVIEDSIYQRTIIMTGIGGPIKVPKQPNQETPPEKDPLKPQ